MQQVTHVFLFMFIMFFIKINYSLDFI